MAIDDDRFANLPFDEAIEYLKSKINLDSNKWDDFEAELQAAFFTVAGAKGALLADLREAVERAIAEGQRPEEFQARFEKISEGWAHTGDKAWRSRIIFSTNLQQSYAAGRATYQLDPEVLKVQPYLKYIHGDSAFPRPHHKALDGKVFKANEIPFYPPVGYSCSCRAISLTQREVDRESLPISKLKLGDTLNGVKLEPDPGFNRFPIAEMSDRRQILERSLPKLPKPIADKVRAEIQAIDKKFAKGKKNGKSGS